MGGSKKAANPPFGSLIAGPPNGLEDQVAGLGISEHSR
jgi:hypothetical protein